MNQSLEQLNRPLMTVSRIFYYLGCLLITQLVVRPYFATAISDIAFLISLAFLLLHFLRSQMATLLLPNLLLIGACCYATGAILSSFTSTDPVESLIVIFKFLFLFIFWMGFGASVLETDTQVDWATTFWTISVALNGLAAVAQLTISPDIVPGGTVHWGRATGFTEHVNDMGAAAAICLAPSLSLLIRANMSKLQRCARFTVFVLILSALILSGSLGSMLGASAAIILWLAFKRLSLKVVLFTGVMLLCLVSIVRVQQRIGGLTPLERIEIVTIGEGRETSTQSRLESYKASLRSIAENPVIGVGPMLGGSKPDAGPAVHNVILNTWYESGILGLIGFLIIGMYLLKVGLSCIKMSTDKHERMRFAGLFCGMTAFIVYSMSGPVLYQRHGWLPVALLLALRSWQLRRAASPITADSIN